jgi:hypothetical protein
MEELRKFTARDFLSGACHELEIGSPWVDRWTKTDAFYGRCPTSDIGNPKQPTPNGASDQQPTPEQPTPEQFVPLTGEQRRQHLRELTDKLLILAHRDPAAFMEDGSSQLNKLIDLAKEALAADTGIALDKLTVEHMAALSDDELSAAALKFLEQLPGADYKAIWRRFIGMAE